MHRLDLAVVVLYFAFTLGVGLWVSRHQRSATDYFLGARNLPAWAILLSIVATETSALTVISIPGIGARADLTFLQLTIGYLMVEAHAAEITMNTGRTVPAPVVGDDHVTGFGVLRAIEPLKIKPLPFGRSADVK